MGRGQYGHSYIGQTGQTDPALAEPPPPPPSPLDDVTRMAPPSDRSDPWARVMQDVRQARRQWTDEQKRDFQRQIGMSAIGSVAGAALWKEHRIWGFLLGGMAGGGLGRVIFAPTSPDNSPW